MAAQKKSRCWLFTIQDWQSQPESVVAELKRRLSAAKYWVIGAEIAPSTGKPHGQGFLWTHNQVRVNTVKEMVMHEKLGTHVKIADNKAFEMMEYCKKDGKWEEWGTPPASQKEKGEKGGEKRKREAREQIQLAKKGKWDEMEEMFPHAYIRSFSTFMKINMLASNTDRWLDKLDNRWYYGRAGSGKSLRARREFYDAGLYTKPISHENKWWDGYRGHPTVLIEDVSPFNKKLADDLKIWGQHYDFSVEVKGFTLNIRPERIIVTSQYRINDIWEDEETREALHRRFKEEFVDAAIERPLNEEYLAKRRKIMEEKERETIIIDDEQEGKKEEWEAFDQCAQEIEIEPIMIDEDEEEI